MTLINNTKCLFFARRAIFHVKNVTEANKKPDYYTQTLGSYNNSAASNCANYSDRSGTFPLIASLMVRFDD